MRGDSKVPTRSFATLISRLRPSVLLIGLLIGGFSTPARADAETTATVALLAASELSLGIDMLQTLNIRWHPASWETNPILGRHPSDVAVINYFDVAMVGTALVTYALPKNWRMLAPILVLAVQVPMIARNASYGLQIRF